MDRRHEITTFHVPSPLGRLRGAATRQGLALLSLPASDFFGALSALSAGRRVGAGSHPVQDELAAYFAGTLTAFDVAVDLSGVGPFAQQVLGALLAVPHGELVTYGDLAKRVGRPRAARAVGGAVGANPVLIVVPCHRVVAADGRLGGFSGGLPAKRRLLEIEGHDIREAAPGTGGDERRWSRARVRPAGHASRAHLSLTFTL